MTYKMDPAKENPSRVDPETESCVDDETCQHSPTSMVAMSKVLEDNDLLTEILLHTSFPTTLVNSALICTRWLLQASDQAFLQRFREIHPPRLLGFYISNDQEKNTPHFVPILPQPLELAAVVHRANSRLSTYQGVSSIPTCILGCQNGNILIRQHHEIGTMFVVLNLFYPESGVYILPLFPRFRFTAYTKILSKEEGDDFSYLYVLMHHTIDGKHKAYVYMLQDGAWCMNYNLTIEQLPRPWSSLKSVLVKNKIYVPAGWSNIIVLDLTASSFFIIQLPQGVEYSERNTILSRANDVASIYLIHVKQLQLRIWIHKGCTWLLVDTLCLRDMCTILSMSDGKGLLINQVEDNADFVFLEMGQCAFYLDIKRRTMHKVYEKENNGRLFCELHPLMMIWPPVFPVLKDDPTSKSMLLEGARAPASPPVSATAKMPCEG